MKCCRKKLNISEEVRSPVLAAAMLSSASFLDWSCISWKLAFSTSPLNNGSCSYQQNLHLQRNLCQGCNLASEIITGRIHHWLGHPVWKEQAAGSLTSGIVMEHSVCSVLLSILYWQYSLERCRHMCSRPWPKAPLVMKHLLPPISLFHLEPW